MFELFKPSLCCLKIRSLKKNFNFPLLKVSVENYEVLPCASYYVLEMWTNLMEVASDDQHRQIVCVTALTG